MLRKSLERIGYMVMYTKLLCILLLFISINSYAEANNAFDLAVTNNIDLQNRLKFFDNLYDCIPYRYIAQPSGYYEIYGKYNEICHIKWTLANCNFPKNVYQDFAKIQKKCTLERLERLSKGYRIELKDKDYRYLYQVGNKYCFIKY